MYRMSEGHSAVSSSKSTNDTGVAPEMNQNPQIFESLTSLKSVTLITDH